MGGSTPPAPGLTEFIIVLFAVPPSLRLSGCVPKTVCLRAGGLAGAAATHPVAMMTY